MRLTREYYSSYFGRTSNHEVCLCLPFYYPQLIELFATNSSSGLLRLLRSSPWPWVDHFASGLSTQLNAQFGLAFATAPALRLSCLLRRITRRLIKQKAHDQAFPCGHSPLVACRCTVSGSISLPSPRFFSPFLRRWCAIGHQRVFSLGTWSSRIPTDLLEPRGTQDLHPAS